MPQITESAMEIFSPVSTIYLFLVHISDNIIFPRILVTASLMMSIV
jgi:hypothetical protein